MHADSMEDGPTKDRWQRAAAYMMGRATPAMLADMTGFLTSPEGLRSLVLRDLPLLPSIGEALDDLEALSQSGDNREDYDVDDCDA